jgi:short-subunit dehydrogenase
MKQGHNVAVCGRDLTKLPAELKNSRLYSYQVDVSEREQILEAVSDFSKKMLGLDLVIAGAGVSVPKKTKIPDFVAAAKLIDINVKGVMFTFEAALNEMLPKKHGHIVAIGSVAGMVGLPGAGPYSASKAAVLKLCESLALDLPSHGISVTAIAPGFVDTPLTRKNPHPMPFMITSDDAAKRIIKAIDAKKVLLVFPWQMATLMWILERLPRFFYRYLMSFKRFNYSRGI